MAQIDASGMVSSYSAFAEGNVDHNTFVSASPTYYQWQTSNSYYVTALGSGITSGLAGTVNAVSITDSSANPALNITGLDVALADLVDTGDATAMYEKFWDNVLAGDTTILTSVTGGPSLDMMGDFADVHSGQVIDGGNDTFRGNASQNSGTLTGDAVIVDANATLNGGNDVFDNVCASYLIGDVGNGLGPTAGMGTMNGGNDTFTLTDPRYFSSLSLGYVIGDVDQADVGSISHGGKDQITLVNISSISNVVGDNYYTRGVAKGGNDTIDMETTIPGRSFVNASNILGDDYQVDATGGAFTWRGGNDTLTVHNVNGSLVSGDFYYNNDATAFGGDDTLDIAGTFPLTTPSPPYQIVPNLSNVVGDGYSISGTHPFTGGDDAITVSDVYATFVGGDVYSVANSTKFRGGNDTIVYTYDNNYQPPPSPTLTGDAQSVGATAFTGGDDIITANLADALQSSSISIFGDTQSYSSGGGSTFTGGDDIITANLGALQTATIFGDAPTISASGDFHINLGNDRLTGGAGNDTIYGDFQVASTSGGALIYSGGDDVLDGRGGNDNLIGGEGIDTAVFSLAQSVYVDLEGIGGSTTVFAVGQGNDRLTGIENVTGSSKKDVIYGDANANTLDGAGGADMLAGRDGDDTYIVDNTKDVVIEAHGGGDDTVLTSVNYTLDSSSPIEKLATTANGGTDNLKLTGNKFAQTIVGNAGNNTIDGKGGADLMKGLGGNDHYIVDNAGDQVREAVGGGNDTVSASHDFALESGQEIERLTTTKAGGTTKIDLSGNEFDQTIIGNDGKNVIDGGDGNDTLRGLDGNDTFVFDTALDAAHNVDHIVDFDPGHDGIILDSAIFTAIAGGQLAASAFFIGSAAHDANDRIIYDPTTGALIYDSNGNGAGHATQFATLSTGLALTNQDFHVLT